MPVGAPKQNTNAEKWTFENAEKFFKDALELSFDEQYDFLGEIAKKLGSYIDVFDYLTDKFPSLNELKKQIKRNCEANCFSNSKKGNINTAIGIVNLKSNHGWTDRADLTSGNKPIQAPPAIIFEAPKNSDEC